MQELGQAQRDAKRRAQQKREALSSTSSPKRSPKQRMWRNTQTLSDLMGEADGRLPPIAEDKCFPSYYSSDDLDRILADPVNLTDSPDLGPPPIAHFEEGDPIKFDASDPRRASEDSTSATGPSDPPLPANLETRRRRRESSHSRDTLSRALTPEVAKPVCTTQDFADPGQPVTTGAKRKLNARDEDEQPVKELERDDRQFERKDVLKPMGDKIGKAATSKFPDRPSSRTERSRGTAKENSAPLPLAGRRALGPKSANTDPQSPAKINNVGAKDKPVSVRESLAQQKRDRDLEREKPQAKTSIEPIKPTVRNAKVKEPEVVTSYEPETPAPPPLDLLSPTSTEPSVRQEGRGDTPPPPDLGPDSGTGSFGRASRRSRGSVSYAEPSLRDKMRRPTKELVDAVGAEERARQARAMNMNSLESALAKIKIEEGEEVPDALANWGTTSMSTRESNAQKERQKAETTSPLGKKAAVVAPNPDLPASVLTGRKQRRTSTFTRTAATAADIERETSKPRTAPTIAALAKPKQQRQHGQSELRSHAHDDDAASQRQRQSDHDRTSVFDFTGSSPESKSTTVEQVEDLKVSSRSARRHSSVPALSDHGKGSLAIARRTRRESLM